MNREEDGALENFARDCFRSEYKIDQFRDLYARSSARRFAHRAHLRRNLLIDITTFSTVCRARCFLLSLDCVEGADLRLFFFEACSIAKDLTS